MSASCICFVNRDDFLVVKCTNTKEKERGK